MRRRLTPIDFLYVQHYPELILSHEEREQSVCMEVLLHMYDSSRDTVQSTLFLGAKISISKIVSVLLLYKSFM